METDAGALAELAHCLKLRPDDSEAQALEDAVEGRLRAAGADAETKPDPLERIVRSFDAVAFRQAAQMLDQMDAARLAALPPEQRAEKLAARQGFSWIGACCWRRSGCTRRRWRAMAGPRRMRDWPRCGSGPATRTAARKEARTALELAPSADAYLVMGRLDLAADHLDEASQ